MPEEKNRYTCQVCGGQIVTIDREVGVTPFMIKCRAPEGCSGDMYSAFYNEVNDEPTYEWRKPTVAEYEKLHPREKDHVDQGGLLIYKIS
jgi:hypothetical protein